MSETADAGQVAVPQRAPGPLARFFPGYFAMVMATGITAIGCRLVGIPVLDLVLYAVACVGYLIIAAFTTARLVRYPRLVVADLTNHAKGFAFTTAVAASEVLGAASVILLGWGPLALALWWIGLGLWAVLGDVFPLGMYAVATFRMRLAIGLNLLGWLPAVALAVALLAWTATFIGLVLDGAKPLLHSIAEAKADRAAAGRS